MNNFALIRNPWTAWLFTTFVTIGIASGSANAQPQAIFPPATQFSLSGTALPVFTGDFNDDGVPDLAYLTESNSLEIVLSVGTNTPTTVTTPSLCSNAAGPAQVNFADVNNDHKLDLIFSCNGYLTIQFGNGNGTFQTPAHFTITAGVPVLVDLNGDGFLDIAAFVSSSTAPQVAAFLNQGTTHPGVFRSAKLYPVPKFAAGLVDGDFNGDGKQDLMTTVASDPSYKLSTGVSILYGNGDGTLKAAQTVSTANFSSFTTGDFNRDGVTDLALLVVSSSSTSLFTSVQIQLG